jgi:hypothetical protein
MASCELILSLVESIAARLEARIVDGDKHVRKPRLWASKFPKARSLTPSCPSRPAWTTEQNQIGAALLLTLLRGWLRIPCGETLQVSFCAFGLILVQNVPETWFTTLGWTKSSQELPMPWKERMAYG